MAPIDWTQHDCPPIGSPCDCQWMTPDEYGGLLGRKNKYIVTDRLAGAKPPKAKQWRTA